MACYSSLEIGIMPKYTTCLIALMQLQTHTGLGTALFASGIRDTDGATQNINVTAYALVKHVLRTDDTDQIDWDPLSVCYAADVTTKVGERPAPVRQVTKSKMSGARIMGAAYGGRP